MNNKRDRASGKVAIEPAVETGLLGKLMRAFGISIDSRSLAAYRITLGLVVLFDQLQRISDTSIFLSDDGVWPRRLAVRAIDDWRWSLHFVNGTVAFQYILLLITILAALCMIIGWRTRLATALCWLLVASAHGRNPYILNGGDTYLRCLLFWSIFIPMAEVWAVDRVSRRSAKFSIPLACFVAQIFLVYIVSGLWKTHEVWRESGTALGQALEIKHLLRPFGEWVYQFESMNKLATLFVVYLEIFGPLLLLIPFVNRVVRLPICLLLIAFHLLSGLMMDLGIFAMVGVAAWVALLPAYFWDRFGVNASVGAGTHIPVAPIMKHRWQEHAMSVFLAATLTLVGVWLAGSLLKKPTWREPIRPVLSVLQLEQRWKMFAGRPARKVDWVVCRAVSPDGREFDVLNPAGRRLWAVPQYSHQAYPSEHWRKYLKSAMAENSLVRWHPLARWLQSKVGEEFTIEIYAMRIYRHDDGSYQRQAPELVYKLSGE